MKILNPESVKKRKDQMKIKKGLFRDRYGVSFMTNNDTKFVAMIEDNPPEVDLAKQIGTKLDIGHQDDVKFYLRFCDVSDHGLAIFLCVSGCLPSIMNFMKV